VRQQKFSYTLLVVSIAFIAACKPGDRPAADTAEKPVDLRVMSFNIEWGGAKISFANVVEAIRLSGADIVGIQEAEGNLQRLAADLGWNHDLRNYTISRFPVIEPPGADGRYDYVEVEPGKIVAIGNVHLPSDPYGPDAVRDGAALEEVLELERTVRLPKILPYLEALPRLVEQGIPVFLTGDFNAPAHTDWVAKTVGSRPFLRYPVSWPVSRAAAAAGFRDSWREVHPDPLANPGLTWWAGRPALEEYAPGANDPEDRIDFLWFAGPVTVHSSEIVGEAGGPEVSISVMPWPSDHRGVVSSFSVQPAAMPELATTSDRVYRTGDPVEVIYNFPDPTVLSVVNATVDEPVVSRSVRGTGREEFAPELFTAGHYRVRVQRPGEKTLQRDFWVLERNAVPSVEVVGTTFRSGDPIPVRWRNAPGNRNDYVAAYQLNVATDYENGLAWSYIDSLPEGNLQLDEATTESGWPLEPGTYVIRLVKDDGYEPLAESASFVIE
jgi:endonuclease/exonuclease/phosphatase family metal-dependent hydrolase